jgi:hypothetical protein
MELGQHQMQVILSLVVILVAALVALICDLLKGNNEQLRELAIELKVRREEENKRFQMLAPHFATPALAPAPALATAMATTMATAMERSAKGAPQIEEPAVAGRPQAAPVTKRPERREKRAIAPEALAAIQRGEQLAAALRPRRVPDRVPTERPAAEYVSAEQVSVQPNEPVVKVPVVEVLRAAAAPVSAVVKKSAGASRDWGSVLAAGRHPGLAEPNAAPSLASAVSELLRDEPALPAGFQDGFVLTRLVESRQPVSGLVVSIGVNTSQDTNRSLPADVRALIQSLIGPRDFAAQSGADEFLLIYPGERGASAQRRLSQIAEQLWDFQLRSMGSLSILFSWGGVEVRSESIDEAIASATERMQETRRGRRVLTMEPRADAPLRRAV